jgi:hypothetical protein
MDSQQKINIDHIKANLELRAKKVNEDCETNFLRIGISSTLEVSPVIDKYSTWLLVGCGAIAALMINNVESILPFLGKTGFKQSIYILACSAVFGLMQKYRSLCVQAFNSITEKLISGTTSLNSIQQNAFQELYQEANQYGIQLQTSPDVDLKKIRKEISDLLPFFLKRNAMKNFDKGAKDYLHGWKKMIGSFKIQVLYFILQFILFIIFLVFAASKV